MKDKGEGLVFIISAPSGTGKTTLLKEVMSQLSGLHFSVSYTTRSPRASEKEGEDYHFVSPPVFEEMVEKDEFLEWSEVLGKRYGTARAVVNTLKSEKVDLILDLDTQGAKKVKERMNHSILIYILPPSFKALGERLVKRGLDSPEMIQLRLSAARKDIEEARWYHYAIVNDKVQDAVEKLKAVIIAERCRKQKHEILDERIKRWEEDHG
jgi:guanylate kinase